jgi:hypothetical protein
MKSLSLVLVPAALLFPSVALAQQQSSGALTAPTVLGESLDGSTSVPAETSTLLFNGVVPRNGFMLQPRGNDCVVNDHGIASFITGPNGPAGFSIANGSTFITPPGYKPMGPVNVICGTRAYVAARAW